MIENIKGLLNKTTLSLIFIYFLFGIGFSYAYFAFREENTSAIVGNVVAIDADLEVELVVGTNTKLVPMNDAALSNALNGTGGTSACVDANGNLSCQVYKISLTNTASRLQHITGSVELYEKDGENNNYINLKWQELTNLTTIKEGSIVNGMAKSILDFDITLETNETKEWYIAVWLSETDYNQTNMDKGEFEGTVTFESLEGSLMKGFDYTIYELLDAEYSVEDSYFRNSTYLETIKNVSFVNYIDTTDSLEYWDMSTNEDNSVIAWINNNEIEGYYDVYIGSNKKNYASSLGMFFSSMYELENIDFSNLDTSFTNDMTGMFFCTGNQNFTLDVSNLDTSNVTDMSGMFGYSELSILNVNSFDTSKVTNMYGMFFGCYDLTSLDVSNFDTNNVTDMGNMFGGCSSLTSLDVSNFDTNNVTNMSDMFYQLENLNFLDVSNFDTSKVTNMGSMFYGCSKLTELDVSNFDTGNVTNMFTIFSECSSLTSLDVSHFSTINVTNMVSMFSGCSSLTELDVSNFDTSNVDNMAGMFSGCSSLTELDVSNFNTSNVINMIGMFDGCSNLIKLDLSNFDTSKVTEMNLMFRNCSSLLELNLSSFDTSNVTYMSSMFYKCNKLTTEMTIMNTGTTSYDYIFDDAATEPGAQITVNYTSDTTTLVDNMINTKSSNSNVIKGSLVS